MRLVEFEEDEKFDVKVVTTPSEFKNLLELGFEYVSDYENKKVLKKGNKTQHFFSIEKLSRHIVTAKNAMSGQHKIGKLSYSGMFLKA